MLPGNHSTGTVWNIVKLNGNVLTENNVTSSATAKIASTVERKSRQT